MECVIGAVLGVTTSAGGAESASLGGSTTTTLEARTCYAIPFRQDRDGEMLVDVEFHKTMMGLHARVNPEERVLGWFSAGSVAEEARALLHEFFVRDSASGTAVHLMLDADFVGATSSGSEILSASVGETVLASTDRESGESIAAGVRFSDVSCEVNLKAATLLGIDALKSASSTKGDDDVEGLAHTMGKLGALLAQAQAYVDAVAAGERQGDAEVGRALSDALSNVPQLTKSQLDKVFGDSVEDVMMVQYLTNLTKSQLVLAEKLHTAALLI